MESISRIISGRCPPPGHSPIADAIRARRGSQSGITPLDAALLHVPPVAAGWNSLLGAVRTEGKLPADVREIMILRIGAINGAAYEWIQHEQVGRQAGLTNEQLYLIRDTQTPLPPSPPSSQSHDVLTALQTAALIFADQSTRVVTIDKTTTDAMMRELKAHVLAQSGLGPLDQDGGIEEKTEDLYVEASAVVAVYNMVSRFLVAVDAAGMSDNAVPWPVARDEHFVSVPSTSSEGTSTSIHAITIRSSPDAPWLVFTNSLLTNLTMWEPLIPFLITAKPRPYNILIHSQRGHGLSTLPTPPHNNNNTSIESIASDVVHLLKALSIPTPVHAVIGVSQGGATALGFARSWPSLTRGVVACDTSVRTPVGNKEAWAERIGVAFGGVEKETVIRSWNALEAKEAAAPVDFGKGWEYARTVGMKELANITLPRWFGSGSKCGSGNTERSERREWVARMVEKTSPEGFVAGAKALGDYDLLKANETGSELFTSPVERVLLIAGSLDGDGKVSRGMRVLQEDWNAVRCKRGGVNPVEYVEIKGAGHLPMIDETERFAEVLREFLDAFQVEAWRSRP